MKKVLEEFEVENCSPGEGDLSINGVEVCVKYVSDAARRGYYLEAIAFEKYEGGRAYVYSRRAGGRGRILLKAVRRYSQKAFDKVADSVSQDQIDAILSDKLKEHGLRLSSVPC